MAQNKLTDAKVRTAKTDMVQEWVSDGGGLYLSLKATGSKSWVFRYAKLGKAHMLGLGAYPAISLGDARIRRDEIKKQIAHGIDPREKKASLKTFREVSIDYFTTIKAKKKKSTDRILKIQQAMNKHVLPVWADREIATIKARDVIALLQKTEQSGSYIVKAVHSYVTWVFEYAFSTGDVESIPIAKASLNHVETHHTKNMRAMKFDRVPAFIEDLNDYGGLKITKLAIRFLMLTALRTMELRKLQWAWIDIDKAIITIPPEAHKTGKRSKNIGIDGERFYVLLSKQAIRILEKAREITGGEDLVFPSPYNMKKMASDAIINDALDRMGWIDEHSGHGFRALFRSQMEIERADVKLIQLCLNHSTAIDKTDAAYLRGMSEAFHPERKIIMQKWADLIDKQK